MSNKRLKKACLSALGHKLSEETGEVSKEIYNALIQKRPVNRKRILAEIEDVRDVLDNLESLVK